FEAVRRQLGVQTEPVYAPDLPGEALETRADITAARALGWEPTVGLEEGLRRSIAYIRQHVLEQPDRPATHCGD
ncbi:MAG TPA: hypothetical protein VF832_17695, partial [Longimicrobiales bacterium]